MLIVNVVQFWWIHQVFAYIYYIYYIYYILYILYILYIIIIIIIIVIIIIVIIIIIYYCCYYYCYYYHYFFYCYYYYYYYLLLLLLLLLLLYLYLYICGFSITVQPGCFFKNGGNSPAHKAITKQLLVIRWEIPMEVAAPSHDHDAMTMPGYLDGPWS